MVILVLGEALVAPRLQQCSGHSVALLARPAHLLSRSRLELVRVVHPAWHCGGGVGSMRVAVAAQ